MSVKTEGESVYIERKERKKNQSERKKIKKTTT